MFSNFHRIWVCLLFCLLVLPSAITARPSFGRRSPAPTTWMGVSDRSLNTNSRRLAAGLPPMPPVKRSPTRTGSARRQTVSQVAKSGKIKVSSGADSNTLGFLQLTGAQDRYIVGSASSADTFTTNIFTSGSSPEINLFDTDAPASGPFLAGLISPGVELLSSNSNAAIVGRAPVTTSQGSTPQSGGSPSIPGTDYETAIWTYNPSGNALTPQWTNFDSSTPPITLVWDPVGQTLYLTANPSAVILNHPGAQAVSLSYI